MLHKANALYLRFRKFVLDFGSFESVSECRRSKPLARPHTLSGFSRKHGTKIPLRTIYRKTHFSFLRLTSSESNSKFFKIFLDLTFGVSVDYLSMSCHIYPIKGNNNETEGSRSVLCRHMGINRNEICG